MTELSYRPVKQRRAAFLKKAGKHPGFKAAYDGLAIEYAVRRRGWKPPTSIHPRLARCKSMRKP